MVVANLHRRALVGRGRVSSSSLDDLVGVHALGLGVKLGKMRCRSTGSATAAHVVGRDVVAARGARRAPCRENQGLAGTRPGAPAT